MSGELIFSFIYLLTGVVLIFLAAAIFRDNLRSRLNRSAAITLFFGGLGPLFIAVAGFLDIPLIADGIAESSLLVRLQSVWELFFPSLLIFALLYPVDRVGTLKYPRIVLVLYLPVLAHVVISGYLDAVVGFLAPSGEEAAGGLFSFLTSPMQIVSSWLLLLVSYISANSTLIFGIVNMLYAAVAWVLFERGGQGLTNPRLVAQFNLILWAMRIGLGLYILIAVVWMLLPSFFAPTLRSTFILFSLIAGAGVFIYATIRHQFLDLSLIFRQTFVSAIVSAVLVAGYIVLAFNAQAWLGPIAGERSDVAGYVLIALALLVFQPIYSWLDNLVRAMFIRTVTDHRNVLERFSRQIVSIFDQRQLRQVIEEELKTTLLVEDVTFVLYDDLVKEYAVLPNDEHAKRIILERTDLMLRGINLLDSPAYYTSLSEYETSSRLAEILAERRARLIVPLKDARHLLGFISLTDKIGGYRFSSEDLNLLGVLSHQISGALNSARLYADSLERLRLQEEVSMARQIQIGLLPDAAPRHDSFSVSVLSTPSRTVGGDFYDFIQLSPERLGIVIADASGKGMPAALMIAQIQAMIRSELNNGNSISTMMRNVNQLLVKSSSAETYVTLFYAELQLDTGHLVFSNAGHNYPLLVSKEGGVRPLTVGGPVIGAFPHLEYESVSVRLSAGDLLVLFTDGLSEAMNEDEVEYGEERIRSLVCENRDQTPGTIIDALIADMQTHDPTYPPRDDTTIIAIKLNEKFASMAPPIR